jgi:hypothetical protein
MDLAATVERAHADYQAAYGRFVAEQRSSGTRGTAELKILLEDGKGLYRKLWCLDFISNDDEPRMVEMSGDSVAPSPRATGSTGGVRVEIEGLTWNDVEIEWQAPEVGETAFAEWFEKWFDPEDVRQDLAAAFGRVIHSLLVSPRKLSVDLGSAPPEAFWELVSVLGSVGVTAVTVRPSTATAE